AIIERLRLLSSAIYCIQQEQSTMRKPICGRSELFCMKCSLEICSSRKKTNPTTEAVRICGPIPENVLSQINHVRSRDYLRKKSSTAVRIDFIDHFSNDARPWLREDIVRDSVALRDFIDRTLVFDQAMRMSVDEALAHDFLREVREIEKETTAPDTIVDCGNDSIEGWKRRIWEIIQANPF
ncbi:hypothetical protein PFISCL1PPCAC_17007, partial [Pristionchus fissidentatus]